MKNSWVTRVAYHDTAVKVQRPKDKGAGAQVCPLLATRVGYLSWPTRWRRSQGHSPAKRKRAPPEMAMRPLAIGLLSPTRVHFMPMTLRIMATKPRSTATTIRALADWM